MRNQQWRIQEFPLGAPMSDAGIFRRNVCENKELGPIGGGGHRCPTQVFFFLAKNVCKNERIGSHGERPLNPPLIGRRIHFTEENTYLVNSSFRQLGVFNAVSLPFMECGTICVTRDGNSFSVDVLSIQISRYN